VSENITHALLEVISEQLSDMEERRLQGTPPEIAGFIPLVNQAVERMEREGAHDPESYERARESFVLLVIRARAAAVGRGATAISPEDIQAALQGFCPRWPIC
jgi:hypothetical protein